MTVDGIVRCMLSWGYVINPKELNSFRAYVYEMFRHNRVLLVFDGVLLEAIVLFYITNNYEVLYKKSLWHIPEDEPDGHQLYLDKMVCRKMTLSLRRIIEKCFRERFPLVDECYYHRPPCDRLVKIFRDKRRFSNELRSQVS